MNGKAGRWAGLIILGGVFEVMNYLIGAKLETITIGEWIMLALAGSFVGRAVSYMTIFEWVRGMTGLTKTIPHSSGTGETVEPKHTDGFLSAFGELIACPVCAGTWAGAGLLLLLAYAPTLGRPILWTVSAASVAAFWTRATEAVEWSKHSLWEYTGRANRQNRSYQSEPWPTITAPRRSQPELEHGRNGNGNHSRAAAR